MDTDDITKALESLRLTRSEVERGRFGESYIVDRLTGSRYILPTKRPDGTYRNEIRIRPGYLPPEERQGYVPPHRRTQNTTILGKTENRFNSNYIRPYSYKESEPNTYKLKDLNNALNKSFQKNSSTVPQRPYERQYSKGSFGSHGSNKNKSERMRKSSSTDSLKVNDFPPLLTNKQQTTQEKALYHQQKKIANCINNTLKKIREVKLLQEKLKNGIELDPNQLTKVSRLEELQQKLKELRSMDHWERK